MKGTEYQFSHSIERLKQNGVSDNEVSRIMDIPIGYIKQVQHVMKNVPNRQMSFQKRDFDVTEHELIMFAKFPYLKYNYEAVKLESFHVPKNDLSFTERLNLELNK